ncbi:MAG: single-stranded-DNA-specific exonuclease RecJ [Candidatus Lloydbacteria bacterium RIFCSPLOWO2_01_FULL_50_20]|uniref:Single-stranded-DNA-specific exonuclease RecJ n=1 Tax=Candidatus Lloydbacteria bacterium RIFCSPLOWO2_01_FULL_50_20 TaxID=1798665 RepID=A0A1G2DK42_9BACT|nr:MAG: single-stranded-DNA-specific exonuclease RecJ [Candidatus Lloydbacteria bacterium RIFCSPLOWO2_01_FULL_50_20]
MGDMKTARTLHPLTKALLERRGIADIAEQERFLYPDYERDTYDPFRILNMERAVDRILLAMANGERIVIYGDYDCDGIPGSVILHDLLKKIGYRNFLNYIPHRHTEGYGLNTAAVEQFGTDGVKLLVTVDCGITDVEEVALAQKLGIDVIITDHHLPPFDHAEGKQGALPPAYAVINSKQKGDSYPDPMLCGAGVAFKLAKALIVRGNFSQIGEGWEKWLLDMAGLSTIADMVPLKNENRVLAYYGLKVLRRSPRPGLQALLREAGVDQRYLSEEDVGFTIGPRINAASRMDVPLRAFELLSTEDPFIGGERAKHLAGLNGERKLTVARMMKEAKKVLRERTIREVIVVGSPSWRVGVVGIVANQLAEEYDRPVFVWGREGTREIKGSCRSDGRVNLVELMVAVRDGIFIDRGGHEFSGGFSVSHEHIHLLEDALVEAHGCLPKKEVKTEKIASDAELMLDEVNEETFHAIDLLAPFGEGNPKPHFLFRGVRIEFVAPFGKEKNHLKLIFKNSGGSRIEAIGFFLAPSDFPGADVRNGGTIDLVATFEKSYFRGRPELRLRIIDIT